MQLTIKQITCFFCFFFYRYVLKKCIHYLRDKSGRRSIADSLEQQVWNKRLLISKQKCRNVHTYRHKNQSPILKMERKVFFFFSAHSSDAWFSAEKKGSHTKLFFFFARSNEMKHDFLCVLLHSCRSTSILNCQTIENLPAADVAMPKDLYLQPRKKTQPYTS